MPRALLAVFVGATVGLSSSAAAQVCNGVASFAQGPVQVFGTVGFSDNAKSFAGGVGFGGTGLFGQATLGTTSYDNIDGSSRLLGFAVGYQVPLGPQRSVYLCPEFSIGFASGPNNVDVFGDGSVVLDLSETDYSFGLAFGGFASQSSGTRIVPTGSLAMVSGKFKTSDDVSGASDSQSDTFGLLGFGVGFLFNQVFALRPSVAVLFGVDDTSTIFGATVSVNFGRRSHD